MNTFLFVLLVITGLVLIGSILLMNPKHGGIGMGIGVSSTGSTGGNEYGSTKSLEGKLRTIAMVTAILFVGVCLFLPFVN